MPQDVLQSAQGQHEENALTKKTVRIAQNMEPVIPHAEQESIMEKPKTGHPRSRC